MANVATRVYLMADFGKGPRSLGNARVGVEHPGAGVLAPAGYPWQLADGYYGSTFQYARQGEARAWWLVEAESADAARRVIFEAGASRERVTCYLGPHLVTGRILDSGGQS